MGGFVGWSDGRSVCLQKISKTLKRRFREYKLMKQSQPSPVYDWGGKVISWNTHPPTYHQPTTHPTQTLNCKIESELNHSQKTKVCSLYE